MREVNRLRFRTAFLRVDFLWPAEPAALHTLNEHHDAANMQLFSVDVDTFDFLDGIAAATSPAGLTLTILGGSTWMPLYASLLLLLHLLL